MGTQNLITREEKMEEKILHLIGNTSIQMSLGAWWRNVLILCNYHFIQSELLFLFVLAFYSLVLKTVLEICLRANSKFIERKYFQFSPFHTILMNIIYEQEKLIATYKAMLSHMGWKTSECHKYIDYGLQINKIIGNMYITILLHFWQINT